MPICRIACISYEVESASTRKDVGDSPRRSRVPPRPRRRLAIHVQGVRKMPNFEVYWQAGARAAHAEPLYRVTDGEYRSSISP